MAQRSLTIDGLMMERPQQGSQAAQAKEQTEKTQHCSEGLRHAELSAAIQFLASALRAASTFDPTQPDHGRGSVRTALVGVIRLIAELFPNEPSLPVSLNHLLYGLWDLDHGKAVPLLRPSIVSNNPGNPLSEDLFRALPAAAMTVLMSNRTMKRADAGREIARRLTRMGYRHSSGEPFTSSQIGKWREKMMTERPSEDRATANYHLALATVKTMEPGQAVEFLLGSMPSLYPRTFPETLPLNGKIRGVFRGLQKQETPMNCSLPNSRTAVDTPRGIENPGHGSIAAIGGAAENASRPVEILPVDRLTPYKGNARTHSRQQIRQIAESIQRFGFNNPVLIDDNGEIIAGHGRVEAAKLLGLNVVPTLRLSHLSAAEKRAYVLADNRLAEKAGWDREILAIELQGLLDLDFEVELTGFDMGEIDIILDDAAEAQCEPAGPEDEVPDPVLGPTVSQPGDLWVLGKHRLVCGDALDDAAYELLLDGKKAEFVFADPPYNVRVDGHVCGRGRIRHREFAMASGEMTPEAFTDFLKGVFGCLVAHTADGSIHDICMDWRHVAEMMAAGNQVYSELKNLCVWSKTNAGMGSLYRSQHELVFVWKAGTTAHVNNVELGRHGRNRSNVWLYPGITTVRAGRLEELAMHPTVKPVALLADAIKDCSRRSGIILDPFLGSGTTVVAAERTGRRARGIEIDPVYVDVAIRRWQTYTGKTATLAESGQSFEEIEEERVTLPVLIAGKDQPATTQAGEAR
jgi:DNA methylase/ParB-like nuclease domain